MPDVTARARFAKTTAGAGPRLAAKAMASAWDKPVAALVSTGLCGGLDETLQIGEIFVATSVNGSPCRIPVTDMPFRQGALLSVDRIVSTVGERRSLRAQGFAAVEMEAAAVAEQARRRNLPFFCVRAISDTASKEFAVDLNAARDEEGRIRMGRILGQAAMRPVTVLPELLELRRHSQAAARALGAFLATCDF